MLDAMVRPSVVGTFGYTTVLLPEVFNMIAYDDTDLQQSVTAILAVYPIAPHPPRLIPTILDLLLSKLGSSDGTTETKWHMKIKLLPILQVFYFRHLHLISADVALRVLETTAALLENPQIEVRNLAAVTLSGLIRCSQRDAINMLKVSDMYVAW
jgi:proteasome activator subunit 4